MKRNPDGTRTKEEHRRNIMAIAAELRASGRSEDEAIAEAGICWREHLKREGEQTIASLKKWLESR